MVGDVKGYVKLSNTANCEFSMGEDKIWQNNIVRAFEINEKTNSVLVIDSSATQMGMFDMKDVELKFHCEYFNGVVLPPNLDHMQKMMESSKRIDRKVGYNTMVKNMVIANSLQNGEFGDQFLFQKS